MKIIYSPQARKDLREVKDYICNVLKNPIAAESLTQRIIKSVHLLSSNPNLGIKIRDKINRTTEFRCVISGNFGVFYFVAEDTIRVVRILDLRSDYLRTLFSD